MTSIPKPERRRTAMSDERENRLGWVVIWTVAVIMTLLAGWCVNAHAQTAQIQVQFAHGGEPDLKEFHLYYGTTTGTYAIGYTLPLSSYLAPPAWMTLPVPLDPGKYYFVVTAVDTSGNESGWSNEATLTVPNNPPGACSAFAARLLP
jgi:hypothetical protein